MITGLHRPLSAADEALLRAWRRGELDPEASHAFETRLFLEPALLRAAQADQALAAGLAAERPTAASSGRGRVAAWTGWALAAGLAGVAVWPLLSGEDKAGAPHGNVEWVSLDVRRGDDTLPLVSPRPETRLLALELPAPSAEGRFAVRLLHRADRRPALQISDLQANDGLLSLAFERQALGAGEYLMELYAADGADDAPPLARLAFRYRP
jgi:hypothetical protein